MLIGAGKQRAPTRDHVVPRSKKTEWNQIEPRIVVVCYLCNHHKGQYFIEEWLNLLRIRNDARAAYVEQFIAMRNRSASKYSAEWVNDLSPDACVSHAD